MKCKGTQTETKTTCCNTLTKNRNTRRSLGEREMLREHEPQASGSKAFSSSPVKTFTSVSKKKSGYKNLLKTLRNALRNKGTKITRLF